MSEALPEPMVPAECDCAGLPFMPLEHARLTSSDFTGLTTGDEFKAGVILWCASWSQRPAASLPDDDRILARLSGYSLSEWKGLREMALHNWVKCSDGRLYHPVIADLAVRAFEKRLHQSARATSRWAKEKARTAGAKPPVSPAVPTASEDCAQSMQGGRGKLKGEDESGGGVGASAPNTPDDWPAGDLVKALVAAVSSPWLDPQKSPGLITTSGRLPAWRREGASWEHDVVPVVTGLCAAQRSPVSTWKFFDAAMARAIAENHAAMKLPEPSRQSRGPPSIVDRIGAENAEARTRALRLLDANQ